MKMINLKKEMLLLLGISFLVLYSCQKPIDPIEKPKKTISIKEAKQLQDNYIRTRSVILKDTFGYEDSREVWFSLEELEQYLSYVKQEATKKGYQDLGVRIYFGANDPTEKRKFGLSTVFLAPTGKKEYQRGSFLNFNYQDDHGENIYEIDPLNRGGVGDPPVNY
ncbi:hypothetical protein GTQ40_03695 [Flavobacteriaceae bacterium R38]|nr:hypothetical protein [Flavobacteriaceae bacterium R38]